MKFFVSTKNEKRTYMTIYMPTEGMKILKSAANEIGVSLGVLTHLAIIRSLTEKNGSDRIVLSKSKINDIKEELIQEALQKRAN